MAVDYTAEDVAALAAAEEAAFDVVAAVRMVTHPEVQRMARRGPLDFDQLWRPA